MQTRLREVICGDGTYYVVASRVESSAHLSWLLGQGLLHCGSVMAGNLLAGCFAVGLSLLLLRAWPATTLRLGRRETLIFITFHKPRTTI